MTHVFVYGTLLAGERNHCVLRGSRCLGPARTPPRFKLVDLGTFPGMLVEGTTAVVGELYEVGDEVLTALDRLESHPTFYVRTPIILAGWRRAATYILPASYAAGRAAIASGDWRSWPKVRR